MSGIFMAMKNLKTKQFIQGNDSLLISLDLPDIKSGKGKRHLPVHVDGIARQLTALLGHMLLKEVQDHLLSHLQINL